MVLSKDNDDGYGFIDCRVAGSQVTSEAAAKIASFYIDDDQNGGDRDHDDLDPAAGFLLFLKPPSS